MPDTSKKGTRLLTRAEAARYLSISERTIWTLQKEGRIPAVRIRGAVRFDIPDLDAFIEEAK